MNGGIFAEVENLVEIPEIKRFVIYPRSPNWSLKID